MSARLDALVAVLLCAAIVGCGRDPTGPQAVAGAVIFQGQPLDEGHLLFFPKQEGMSEAGATIEKGRFEIPEENGLVPGTYVVRVFSYDKRAAKVEATDMPGDPGNVQFKERIPAKYNTQSVLTAEVSGSDKNEFEFKLE